MRVSSKDGTISLDVIVDDADVPLVEQYDWYLKISRTHPTVMTDEYTHKGKARTVSIAKVILGTVGKKGFTHHENGNTLDNRRENISHQRHLSHLEHNVRPTRNKKKPINPDEPYSKLEHKALIDREMKRFLERGGQIQYLEPRYTIPEPIIPYRGYNPKDDELDDEPQGDELE